MQINSTFRLSLNSYFLSMDWSQYAVRHSLSNTHPSIRWVPQIGIRRPHPIKSPLLHLHHHPQTTGLSINLLDHPNGKTTRITQSLQFNIGLQVYGFTTKLEIFVFRASRLDQSPKIKMNDSNHSSSISIIRHNSPTILVFVTCLMCLI